MRIKNEDHLEKGLETGKYTPADKPTMYFIGVTTAKSSIMKVFPRWAQYLDLGDVELKGIDLKLHDARENYREVLHFIKGDRLSKGALVTTHKVDIYRAGKDILDLLGHDAHDLGEISSIYKLQDKLVGEARDSITSGLAMHRFIPDNHWKKTGGEVFLIGAGGSSIALSTYLMRNAAPDDRPGKIIVSNRSEGRLDEIERIHHHVAKEISLDIPREYHLTPEKEQNDEIAAKLKPGSLIANATGLGKDTPGSPLTDKVEFPENSFVWDFNYRGDLLFLEQGRRQEKEKNLTIVDGWDYFIYGWTRVIADVFQIDIPVTGPQFEEISTIAAEARSG